MTIRIVTDSATDVPPALAEQLGIVVVPVYINIGNQSYLDGLELSRRTFFENLAAYPELPTTAAPASGAFTEAYNRLMTEGATEILSIHIASSLSATLNAARLGAEDAPGVPITLFDTQQITMGAGLQVLAAAEAAAAGKPIAAIVEMLETMVGRARILASLDTLEFLRRSGRVSWAQFGLGTLLQIKPVVIAHRGEVSVAARVRTRARSLDHLVELSEQFAPFERLAVLHANAPDAAEALTKRIRHLFPDQTNAITMEITPAIGAHIGPGAVGLAFISETGD